MRDQVQRPGSLPNGRWPGNLDDVQSLLLGEVLIDPFNQGPFVYGLCPDGFTLYSVGPNRIDENGQHTSGGPDDWPIWPSRGWSWGRNNRSSGAVWSCG